MTNNKAFKYRLYPTKKQEQILIQTLTTCRFLYNNALAQRIKTYKNTQKSVTYYDQTNELIKQKNDYQKQVHSQVLQESLKRLDSSFSNFDLNAAKNIFRVGTTPSYAYGDLTSTQGHWVFEQVESMK